MPRYDDLISKINTNTIFCNNLGIGEQGAILSKIDRALYICPNLEQVHQMRDQLTALGKTCVAIDDFDKPFTLSKFQSSENLKDIIKACYLLAKSTPIIISTPRILFSFVPNIETFKKNIISLDKINEYNIIEIEKKLVYLGYKKVDSVIEAGEFARRGDILDIFTPIDDYPTRIDFFDSNIEEIYTYDNISFEKLTKLNQIDIVPNKITLFDSETKENILKNLNKLKIDDNLFFELYNLIERDEDIPLEFLYPFTDSIYTLKDIDLPIVIANAIQFESSCNNSYEYFTDKINQTFKKENLIKIYKNNEKILKINDFYINFAKNLIFFDNFDLKNTDLQIKFNTKNIINFDFKSIKFPSFLYNLESLQIELNKYKNKQIYLCLSSQETLGSIKRIFSETNIPFSLNVNSTGIILTDLNIPYNICFEDEDKIYIGSSNFAHKKEVKKEKKQTIKYLPKAGEYVVHSTHGIAKCEGLVTVSVSGVDKEYFKLSYRGGDILYVPYENADCLSLYMAEGNAVTTNKLGGKEFSNLKQKAIKSIEDMSEELLELYAKRKAAKGYVYPEDDYLYTEFENAFEYTETDDQLQAIADIKRDMTSGKVMDRLICGDVGFGKTEVAMRALFKAVESGKQVAVLAPTTILSLQHYMTAQKRTKDFGVNVKMLNRFVSTKEQKEILADLRSGKVNVICGTHRLLSKDVVFDDLGLLILDEEQRFGVKAKEQIKQIKNNVNVLTLSATPIPRTLSMSLMSIRDISIINTPPVDRLPVKTYVMGYNEDIVVNAINDEINRGGQVLIVYNNVEQLPILCNRLREKLGNDKAVFDIAHGQMSEVALENAIKRLYDKETNVFVSTTLIENGVDLPSANTLIVIDSDRLGLSQSYQLRGRVGRNKEQAYAYFTYNKEKILTEESTSRLQALAENTELGSGFKIAMRDLQIRGAGELLGKIQHGHIIKIGYDMYTKLLNETLRKLKGEKVNIEREIKMDIAISSKIPYTFVADESERLKIIAKISNIDSKETARATISALLNEYGKLPKEIYQLCNISLLKALGIKHNIKHITITKAKMSIVFYDDIDIKKLMTKVTKSHFKFEKGIVPTIVLDTNFYNVQNAMNYFIEFLSV
ncbi:MAG: transcription-repair coupling factor [Clostridiales bacterium]|nr:transcription-repair coupling factor [Clostridiales bacterium]